MTAPQTGILLLLLLLQFKHALADYCLQTPWMLRNRKIYGHPGGLAHVAVHLAGSAMALVAMGTALPTLAALLLVEGVVHYHLDWAKDNVVASRELTPQDAWYWYAAGIDQFLHQATYLGMALWWAVAA